MSDPAPPVPRHAATVVILRDRADAGPEIFMVKRHKKSGFMASAYVYPGGKLDEEDCTEATAARCEGLDPTRAASLMAPLGERLDDDAPLSPEAALGLFVAAIREVFEESGILLARHTGGDPLTFADPESSERFTAYRHQLHEGSLSMTELAEREDLIFRLDQLRYFAHWITPTVERRRFNTRFFMARAPTGQVPLHDDRETVASDWLTPDEALGRYDEGAILLAPPTMRTLEDMQGFGSTEALLDQLDAERVVTIMPRLESVDDKMTLLLPGDPLFPASHGVTGPTRVMLDNGRWWSRNG